MSSSGHAHEPLTGSVGWDYVVLSVSIVAVLYTFLGIAILCNDYFMPCLICIQKKHRMSDSVAGATLIAVASSAPEIAGSAVAVIRGGTAMYDLSLYTIVGSGAFDLSMCLGIASLFAAEPVHLRILTVLRDSLLYLCGVILLALFAHKLNIVVWEATCLFLMYILYLFGLFLLEPRPKFVDNKKNDTRAQPQQQQQQQDVDREQQPLLQNQSEVAKSTSILYRIYLVLASPFDLLYRYTIPLQGRLMSGSWFYHTAAFLLAVIYISIFSIALNFLIADIIAPILNISPSMAGLTVLAWGSEVPNTINASIAVKRKAGDMAVSGAIGAQMLNLSMGLGLPWMVAIVAGRSIVFSTNAIVTSVCVLGGITFGFLVFSSLNGMRLSRPMGVVLMLVYVGFLVFECFFQKHK